jgi:plastocyanin
MRRWAWAPFVILVALGLAVPALVVPASAKDPRVIKVGANDFQPASITVQKGDVVQWELETGSGPHVIVNGDSDDPNNAGNGKIFQFTLSADLTHVEWTADKTGTFPYFAADAPQSMQGTIIVTAATPVQLTTWGLVKHLFETP